MVPTTARAPVAPARLGQPVEPGEMLRYLEELGRWRDARRRELDELDRAALAAPEPDELTSDITLSMALWQAVAARHDELLAVWDSGRVGQVERRRLSALIWGRLDAGTGPGGVVGAGTGRGAAAAGSLAVSLPEACRLSDALAGQLRLRMSLDPAGLDLAARLRALRASLERVRDLVRAQLPGPERHGSEIRLERLDRRIEDVTERAKRGADVGGLLGPLEADAARAERDLIVAAATRRDDERDRAEAAEQRDELIERAAEVGRLVADCVAKVRPAPRLAVPRVEALGPVPLGAAEVDAYLERLDAVARAVTLAEQTYAAPLAELQRLRELLDVYRAKATSTGLEARPEVAQLYRSALAVVSQEPVDLARARAVVAAYQVLLSDVPPTSSGRMP
jgi:hypothetical protein